MRHLVLIAVLLAGGAAHAADAEGKAKYKRATAHFSLGKFKQAAKEYEELYVEHPDQHVLLYNIAQANRLAGDFDKALFCYRRYLVNVPKAPNRNEVEQRITEVEAALAELKKKPNEPLPTAPPVSLEPMPTVAPTPAPAPVVETPAPAPVTQRHTPVYKKWWLWTIVGGVAVAGVAVGLGVGLTSKPAFNPDFPEFGPAAATALTIGF